MRVRLFVALCAVLAVGLTACSGSSTPAPPPPSDVAKKTIPFDGDWGWVQQPTKMELGVTHTQDSLDDSEPDAARARGVKILSNDAAIWQNIHLMGFGTLNPEPSPGEFDWGSLDQRMDLVKETGGKAMLTLCCSPDWMKGGPDGETDWDKLERAPLPEHYADFAKLAAAAVQRYPQVGRVLVWNELKGFYSDQENRWDYEGYTALYNEVFKAVKAVRPDVQVGGPYAVITSLDPGPGGRLRRAAGRLGRRRPAVARHRRLLAEEQRGRGLHRARRLHRHPAEDGSDHHRQGVGEVRRRRGMGAGAHAAPDLVGRVLRRGARGCRGRSVRARQRRRRPRRGRGHGPSGARRPP